MAKKCSICSQQIEDRQILTCKYCRCHYHLRCTSISEKRFYNTMTKDHKANWKCDLCRKKDTNEQLISSPTTVKSNSNFSTPTNYVTLREKTTINIPTNNSFQSLSSNTDDEEEEFEDSLPGNSTELNRSCPELLTLKSYTELERMEKEIKDLRLKLQIAENEIDNLVAENFALKNHNKDKDSKIEQLLSFCKSTPTRPNKPKKIMSLNNSKLEPLELTNSTVEIEQQKQLGQTEYAKQPQTKIDTIKSKDPNLNKLCILSTNNRHSIIGLLDEYNVGKNFRYCHFITPNGGIKELVNSIEIKLINYTLNDFCIILIGESDFSSTNDYMQLVQTIKTAALKVQHTNLIIAAPNYVCGATLHNIRVEAFNSMLNLDIQAFGYAYFFDSNLNLTFDMFSTYSGNLLKKGMKNIVYNLITKITSLQELYSSSIHENANIPDQVEPDNKTKFFRE